MITYVFTEHGAIMAATVINTPRARETADRVQQERILSCIGLLFLPGNIACDRHLPTQTGGDTVCAPPGSLRANGKTCSLADRAVVPVFYFPAVGFPASW